MQNSSAVLTAHFTKGLNGTIGSIQKATGAPYELIAGTCLAAMSLASQALVEFEYSDGRKSPVSLFNVIVAESGERKTAVFNVVMKEVIEFQRVKLSGYSELYHVYESELQTWNVIQKSILKQIRLNEENGKSHDVEKDKLKLHYINKPQKPKYPKMLYSDATPEAIIQMLSENIGSAGLISHEGGVVFNGRAMRNTPLYNQLWDGGPVDIERKDHRLSIDNCRFSILVLIQRNELSDFFKKHGARILGNGFFARCLWSITTSTQGYRSNNEQEIKDDQVRLEKFQLRIKELLDMTIKAFPKKVLCLSPEAESRLIDYQSAIENFLLEEKSKHEACAGIISKMPENAIRMAALFHFFYDFEGNEISVETFEHATSIIGYYYNQLSQVLTMGTDDDDANKLYHWLLTGPFNRHAPCLAIAKTEARRYVPYQLRDGVRFNKALKALEESGRISIEKLRNTNGSINQVIHINRA
ncbi:YfjI family protein [Lelliottia wanjuensis]|uniref:YfjI family protein n=1 Tax=Lelliottia wanjuensis TaxID=3050585 RepID=A0AAP4D0K8_9ENTR|nr:MULTISPECIES: YfjI family protein [unclassified Lelliottia]MDK9362941.1 YfjI family protein [Lelliottia sp. V106_12]MDK9616574.1 YfjI family protein [Lelliottia sp. V106_9]